MSLYVELQINDVPIDSVAVTRTTSHGSQPDSVNWYRWVMYRGQGKIIGHVEHRYGDGAVALAAKVLTAIVEAQRVPDE